MLPITSGPPDHRALAVEILAKVKQRLQHTTPAPGPVLAEWDELVRPEPDLHQPPGAADASATYNTGSLRLVVTIRERFVTIVNSRVARRVPRR
jgi:hypothetical protein